MLLPLSLPHHDWLQLAMPGSIVVSVFLTLMSGGRFGLMALVLVLVTTIALVAAQARALAAAQCVASAQREELEARLETLTREHEALKQQDAERQLELAALHRRRVAARQVEALGMPTLMAPLPWERSSDVSSASSRASSCAFSTAASPHNNRRKETAAHRILQATPEMMEMTTSWSSQGFIGAQQLVNLTHLGPDKSFVSRVIQSFYMPPHEHGLRLLNLLASSYHELQETEPPRDELFSVMVKCAFKLADAAATAGAAYLSARAKEFAEEPTDEARGAVRAPPGLENHACAARA